MTHQWALPPVPNEERHLGVFKAKLRIYSEPATYDIRAVDFLQASLIQLDAKLPIAGWNVLAFVDHKSEAPELLTLPQYKHIRGNSAAESRLLVETVNLLHSTPTPPGSFLARKEVYGCYV